MINHTGENKRIKTKYTCHKCGKEFDEPDCIEECLGECWGMPYHEYEPVSPCCHASYDCEDVVEEEE